MKKIASLLLVLCLLLPVHSGLASSPLNQLWDVPMGTTIEEAAAALTAATGAVFDYKTDSNGQIDGCSTPDNKPIRIQGLDFAMSVSNWMGWYGNSSDSSDPSTFQSLFLTSTVNCSSSLKEDIDYFMLYYGQSINKVLLMFKDKFGAPDYERLIARGSDGELYAFDIPTLDGDINLAEIVSSCGSFRLRYVWNNIELIILIGQHGYLDIIEISSYIEQYSSPISRSDDEYKGNYADFMSQSETGITSF